MNRSSEKGPLRDARAYILDAWYANFRAKRDVIVKVHTGQGKTLIGMLMLQSKLNEGKGPTLYLCPSSLLVAQTCEQAKQFGVTVVQAGEDEDIPPKLLDGRAILVTTGRSCSTG